MWDKFIEIIKYIILGIVQGACEILPISSSGHIEIFQHIFNMSHLEVSFSILLHFASLIAVVIFLRKKIWEIAKGAYLYVFKKDYKGIKQARYLLFIIISTIVTGVIGIFLNDYIESVSTMTIIGICLIVNAGWLLIVQKLSKRATKSIESTPWWKAILIGIGQGFGILPGISRSGSALGTAVVTGVKKDEAAEYAFLLFIPIELGAIILEINEITKIEKNLIIPYFLSFLFAGITTYFALKIFLEIIRKKRLSWFSLYCLIVGIICLFI